MGFQHNVMKVFGSIRPSYSTKECSSVQVAGRPTSPGQKVFLMSGLSSVKSPVSTLSFLFCCRETWDQEVA